MSEVHPPAPKAWLLPGLLAGGLVLILWVVVGWDPGSVLLRADRFVGADDVDAWGTQWFYWLFGRRALQGAPFAHTDLLFYPWGKDVYLHTGGNILDAALAAPLRFLLGPVRGYNVFVLLILVSNGLGAWLICRLSLPGVRAGAALAALLFALNPWVLGELAGGRPTQAMLAPLCLFFGLLVRLDGRASWRWAIATGAALAATGWMYWFNAILGSLTAGALLALRWVGSPDHRGDIFRKSAVMGMVAAALALPLAWPMLQAQAAGGVPGLFDMDRWTLSEWAPVTREGVVVGVQVLDLITVSTGFLMQDSGQAPGGSLAAGGAALRYVLPTRALGVVPLMLALPGLLLLRRRPIHAWLLVALLLAVGPMLEWRSGLSNPVYLALVQVVPPLQRLWWPSRAVALLQVGLILPTALAAHALRQRGDWLLMLPLLGFGVELAVVGAAPLPTASARVPPLMICLAGAAGPLLELPHGDAPARLHHQVVHGRPRFGGMVEDNPVFAPTEHSRFMADNAYLAVLDAVTEGSTTAWDPRTRDRALAPELSTGRDALVALGFDLVVADKALLGRHGVGRSSRGSGAALRRSQLALAHLIGPPVYEDTEYIVYAFSGSTLECAAEAP